MAAAKRRQQMKSRLSTYVSVDLTDYAVVDHEDFNTALCWTPLTNKKHINEAKLLSYFDHFQIYATTPTALKKTVRKGVPLNQRAQLWFECSGGRTFLTKHPTLFDENLAEFVFPDPLPVTHYEAELDVSLDHLTERGVASLRRLLMMLYHEFPHIPSCPLLPAIASYFLLFMEDRECHACMSAILQSIDDNYFDCSQRSYAASLRTFQDLAKVLLKPVYRDVLNTVAKSKGEDKSIIFQDWMVWIFKYLPKDVVIRMIDCFMIEGRKIFYRMGLAILIIFHKHYLRNNREGLRTFNSTQLESIRQFVKFLPVSSDLLLKTGFNISGLSRKTMTKYFEHNKRLIDQGKLLYQFDKTTNAVVVGPLPDQNSNIVEPKQWSQIWNMIPDRFYIKVPIMLFTSAEHGCSLKTFYLKAADHEPMVLLIKTLEGEVFGAFVAASWERRKKHPNLSFFGTGESFLFTLTPEVERYAWCGRVAYEMMMKNSSDAGAKAASKFSSMNATDKRLAFQRTRTGSLENFCHYFMAADDSCIIIGGGDGYGLWLDAELNKGSSARCQTFMNQPLTNSKDGTFVCACVELYGLIDT
ncbi:uncharacterized protein TRIADDRAFT_57693 [Trichoplax adhaerens]|uniref:Oxidation resistance protein 1 n=1 Tax=Trichoplax adhaerens TaxID=10228 RepID=B3S058_TRIAD|nr:hypothetical protein TRIADDRAFT_57693 [Trichoplax adhaerens]EDV23947.1 hypothetical protein TRIADDRAFT_57693 [Trichoplax adhaerens]|eukprot:XP_002113473.1 hypothetical protein TRIADDRAFT_57693 [Trichoplax adhaerens]